MTEKVCMCGRVRFLGVCGYVWVGLSTVLATKHTCLWGREYMCVSMCVCVYFVYLCAFV